MRWDLGLVRDQSRNEIRVQSISEDVALGFRSLGGKRPALYGRDPVAGKMQRLRHLNGPYGARRLLDCSFRPFEQSESREVGYAAPRSEDDVSLQSQGETSKLRELGACPTLGG